MELRRANDETSGPAIVFLPGIVAPAQFRYAPLIKELGGDVRAFTKDLEVYDPGLRRGEYSIDTEVDGLLSAADSVGVERFYLYGHSAGGAISLAFAAEHGDRLLGLALDEPASDFSPEARAAWAEAFKPIEALPANERTPAFLKAQVAPGVEPPPSPSGPPPEWMASRPAGIEAFLVALESYTLGPPDPRFDGPVYFSHGSLSNPIWLGIRDRLAARFANFTAEEYEGLHHLNTSHAAQPDRVAASLRNVWHL